jgi:integrase/recombinase XerD
VADLLPKASEEIAEWDRAVHAFLAEKKRRSGSHRTVQSYSRMLRDCFRRTGKPPDRITAQDVFVWAHGIGSSGREPSANTINSRISCLSSFFRFAIRMGLLTTANPCDALERPKIQPAVPRGLSPEQAQRLLNAIPNTVEGRRDRAILLTFLLTGRRRSEVMRLTAGDISLEGEVPYYRYRGKGGKRGRRELPRPAFEAIVRMLADRSTTLEALPADEGLWRISESAFYTRFRGYLAEAGLPPSGLHVLRHTAAKLRRDAGQSVEEVSSFLDHSSLAVTTVYLRRLEGSRDEAWSKVAEAIGAN